MIKIDNKGITLIEMLVVVALAGIIAIAVTTAFADSLLIYNRQRVEERLGQKLRQSMELMLERIRDGNEILAGSTASDMTILVPAIDCTGKIIKETDITLHQPDSISTRDQFRWYIDSVDDPTNHKLKFSLTPAPPNSPSFPGSCRQSVGTDPLTDPPIILAARVQNLLDTPVVPLFQSIDPGTGLPRTPTYTDLTIVVRLVLQDTYRTKAIRAETTTDITLRNAGL